MLEYYKILGLEPNATDEQLKKAYRKLALKYHPDLKSGQEAHFKKIVEAYEAITEYRKRKSSIDQLSDTEKQVILDHLRAKAKEQAKEKARQRAAEWRKKKELEQNRAYTKAIYSFIGIVFLIYFSYKGFHWFLDYKINQDLQKGIATVVGIERNRVVYQFEYQDKSYVDRKYVSGFGIQMFSATGLPLKTGDQFIINFNGEDPEYHRLDFYKVSTETFNRYINLATESLQRYSLDPLNPSKVISKEKARCLSLLTYDRLGLEALGQIYHFDTNPLNKLAQNKISWYFFKNSSDFQWAAEQCRVELD